MDQSTYVELISIKTKRKKAIGNSVNTHNILMDSNGNESDNNLQNRNTQNLYRLKEQQTQRVDQKTELYSLLSSPYSPQNATVQCENFVKNGNFNEISSEPGTYRFPAHWNVLENGINTKNQIVEVREIGGISLIGQRNIIGERSFAEIKQRIDGLQAGSIVTLSFTVVGPMRVPNSLKDFDISILHYGISTDGKGGIRSFYKVPESNYWNGESDCAISNDKTITVSEFPIILTLTTVVPSSGIITIWFNTTGVVNIDNVELCVKNDPVNIVNVVSNRYFNNNIDGWAEISTVEGLWDDDNYAVIVGNDGFPIRHTINGLVPGQTAVLKFVLLANEPLEIGENELTYGILNGSDDIVISNKISNSDVVNHIIYTNTYAETPRIVWPITVSLPFVIPSQTITVFFETKLKSKAYINNIIVSTYDDGAVGNFYKSNYHAFNKTKGDWYDGRVNIINATYSEEGQSLEARILQSLTDEDHRINGCSLCPATKCDIRYDIPNATAGKTIVVSITALDKNGIIVNFDSVGNKAKYATQNSPGIYTFTFTPKLFGTVTISVGSQSRGIPGPYLFSGMFESGNVGPVLALSEVLIDEQAKCNTFIYDLEISVRHNSPPRLPMNIYNMFVKVTYRSISRPSIVSELYTLPSSMTIPEANSCSWWISQLRSNTRTDMLAQWLESSPNIFQYVYEGKEVILTYNEGLPIPPITDWIWGIPIYSNEKENSTSPKLIIKPRTTSFEGIISKIEIFYLANRITDYWVYVDLNGIVNCLDPIPPNTQIPELDLYEIGIKYKKDNGEIREFTQSNPIINVLAQEALEIPDQPWYTQYPSYDSNGDLIKNGIKTRLARWQVARFFIDTDGGLDQCIPATDFVATGTGNLVFNSIELAGIGANYQPCEPEIVIETVTDGSKSEESQSIILPNPSGGTWDITTTINNTEETATIPWNAGPDVLQIRLERLSSIGRGNINVTGIGTSDNPYVIKFIGDLIGINIPLIVADGGNLTGASICNVYTIQNGTKNERQTITVAAGTLFDLVVRYNNIASIPIKYNWSLNQKQASIEAIPAIGPGNVLVTGKTTDRDAEYTGDIIIDFIGSLAATNVSPIAAGPSPYYVAITNWNGGTGASEKQQIKVVATSGTFTIKIFDPNNEDNYFVTSPLNFNSDATTIKSSIVSSGYVTDNEVKVTKITETTTTNEWVIEFIRTKTGIDFKQMETDSSQLRGGDIIVQNISDGSATSDIQRIIVKRATSGYYTLNVNVDGTAEQTENIQWNATAYDVKKAIFSHSKIAPRDISVESEISNEYGVTAIYKVSFNKKFGNVQLMSVASIDNLACSLAPVVPVTSPPYEYKLPIQCDEDIDIVSCQTGPLLGKPCRYEEQIYETIDNCCDHNNIRESANVSIDLSIERDIIDPNVKPSGHRLTIKEAARSKNINTSKYTPYLRDFRTGNLSKAEYNMELRTGLSIILIEHNLDNESGKARIKKYLSSHRELLSTRMVW